MKRLMMVMCALVVVFAVSAFAITPIRPKYKVPVARGREAEQQQRIHQGVRSGELTRGETRTLEREQRDIRQDIREARADGVITGVERRDIRQDQNQANRDIYRLKHNQRERR